MGNTGVATLNWPRPIINSIISQMSPKELVSTGPPLMAPGKTVALGKSIWQVIANALAQPLRFISQINKNRLSATNTNQKQKQTKQKTMKKGTVKFFNESKGFGFIKAEDGEEIFVHASGLRTEIRENDEVNYDVERGKKGLNAVNVTLANN